MKVVQLTGSRFGKLTVKSFSGVNERGYACWLCVCDCGNEKVINGSYLRSGDTTSCGCVHKEQLAERGRGYRKEKHPKWKGGLTDLNHSVRNTKSFSEWRIGVYKASNFTCADCGKRGGKIHAHHKKPLNYLLKLLGIQTPEQAEQCKDLWSVDNGIVLCPSCHKSHHSKNGYTGATLCA